MTNLNWKWGETCPISVPVKSETDIEIGQLLYYDSEGYARPISEFPFPTENLTRHFIGVAMQNCRKEFSFSIRVATRGVFEFEYLGERPTRIGQFVSPTYRINRDTLDDEPYENKSVKIEPSQDKKASIGRIVHLENVPDGKCYVAIISSIDRLDL